MLSIKASDLRGNFKTVCDRVSEGETVIIPRPNNKNVVIISENDYNQMAKNSKNTAYLEKIEQSIQEFKDGKTVSFSLGELEELAK